MFSPSDRTIIDASSPSRHSSTTILFPEAPKVFLTSMFSMASKASFSRFAIITPFPAARPSAFTTIGVPFDFTKSFAFLASSKISNHAVGMFSCLESFFVKTLLASSSAAFLVGPNTFKLSLSNKSIIPRASGASGPTIVKSIFFSLQNLLKPSRSSAFIGTFVATWDVPPFPGAQ